jgi:hypothetical protein
VGKPQTGKFAPDWLVAYNASTFAVDIYISNVETLLIALAQRKLLPEQIDRLAAILQRSERDLLARCTPLPVKAGKRVRAA